MTPLEAMQQLIKEADNSLSTKAIPYGMTADEPDYISRELELETIRQARDTIQLMLDTALPIARFRCFVEIIVVTHGKAIRKDSYTICSPDLHGIYAGLMGLSHKRMTVYIALWEQKPRNADMISGYQGSSKVARYKDWLLSLSYLGETNEVPAEPEKAEPLASD